MGWGGGGVGVGWGWGGVGWGGVGGVGGVGGTGGVRALDARLPSRIISEISWSEIRSEIEREMAEIAPELEISATDPPADPPRADASPPRHGATSTSSSTVGSKRI